MNILELSFHQDQNKWKHKSIHIEIRKKDQIEMLTC